MLQRFLHVVMEMAHRLQILAQHRPPLHVDIHPVHLRARGDNLRVPRPDDGVVEGQAVEVFAAVDEPAAQGLQRLRAHFVQVQSEGQVGVVTEGFELRAVEAACYAH